jgi:hypothetical protein
MQPMVLSPSAGVWVSSFLYMFQALQAHHQEVQIVHAASGTLPLCRCLGFLFPLHVSGLTGPS